MGEDALAQTADTGMRIQLYALLAGRVADVRFSAGFACEDVGQNMLKAAEAGAFVTLGASRCLEVVAPSRLLQGT